MRYIYALFAFSLALSLGTAWYKYNTMEKEIQKLKELNQELSYQNKQNILELKKIDSDRNKELKSLEFIHELELKRKVKYAVQQEKNKYAKDGIIAPVLERTFNFLLTKSDSNKSDIPKTKHSDGVLRVRGSCDSKTKDAKRCSELFTSFTQRLSRLQRKAKSDKGAK